VPNYQAMAASYAQQYGVPQQLFLNQIKQESGFNPSARSGAGALGIAQFMPGTAQAMGVDPMNPQSALDGAARLMAQNYH
jgi:soluble lytic murein transglycosylase-like protein